jgi:isopropylmalate/homocitrate/citramalate synthase
MGKGSGIDSVKMWLEDIGVEANEEEAMKITSEIKLASLTAKRLLSKGEFEVIAKGVISSRK